MDKLRGLDIANGGDVLTRNFSTRVSEGYAIDAVDLADTSLARSVEEAEDKFKSSALRPRFIGLDCRVVDPDPDLCL